jgi:hypothetical protein
MIVALEAAFHACDAFGAAFDRMDLRLRQWPAAGLSLLAVALSLAQETLNFKELEHSAELSGFKYRVALHASLSATSNTWLYVRIMVRSISPIDKVRLSCTTICHSATAQAAPIHAVTQTQAAVVSQPVLP